MKLEKSFVERLEKEFIPNNTKTVIRYDKYGVIEEYKAISIKKIFTITDDINTFYEVVDYIEKKDIKVPNSERLRIKKYNENQQRILFEIYQKDKSKENLNELFKAVLPIAKFMAYQYYYILGIDMKEADITAQEGLLKAIIKYNPDRGNFASYAYLCIKGELLNYRFIYDKNRHLSVEIERIKNQVEQEYQEKLSENGIFYHEMVKEIANRIEEKGICINEDTTGRITKKNVIDKINMNQSLSLEQVTEESYSDIETDPVYNAIEQQDLSEKIEELISSLSKEQQDIIRRRFGLNDGVMETLKELSEDYHCTDRNIFKRQNRAIMKLRKPKQLSKVKGFI